MDWMETLIAALMIFLILALIIYVVAYIVQGLFLTKVAKDNLVDKRWMAWVPVLQDFYLGYVVGTATQDINFWYTYLAATLGGMICSMVSVAMDVSFLTAIGSIAIYAVAIMAMYKIFKIYFKDSAIWMTILCAIFSIAALIIKIIIICKKDFIPEIETVETKDIYNL